MQRSRILLFLVLILFATLAPCGCVLVAGAAAGAAAVVATGEDTVEVVIKKHSLDDIYGRAIDVVEARGSTENRNPEFYRFEGIVGGSHVWVNISPADESGSLLRVRARKVERTLPDPDLAREIASAIVVEVADSSSATSPAP